MKYIRKQEVVDVFHNTRDKTIDDFYSFIGHNSTLYRRTIMGDILVKTKNREKFLYPNSYLIKKSNGEFEIINIKEDFESLYEQAIIHFKEEKQNLFFRYPYEEFQSKFLSDSLDIVLNCCLDNSNGKPHISVIKEDCVGVVIFEHIPTYKILNDLSNDWETLQEDGYKYCIAHAYANMLENIVEIRIEKRKMKEE